MVLALALMAAAAAGDVDRGAHVAHAAGCAACHTGEDGVAYAGGHAIETRYGTFYGPNLTSDPEHGIGDWTEAEFVRAVRHGRSPEGKAYYPAFPYPSYTGMTEADAGDLFAYLRTIAPSPTPDLAHELRFPYGMRALMTPWRWLGFRAGVLEADPEQTDAWNRGAYLVNALGHCGDCHTQRSGLGVPKQRRYLAGSDDPPEPSPNITPHPDGIGDWSHGDLVEFLRTGMTPDGDFAGAGMREVIRDGTARLTDGDRDAMVTYLRALPPLPTKGRDDAPEDPEDEGEDW